MHLGFWMARNMEASPCGKCIDYNGRYMISTFGNVLSMVDAIKSGKTNPAPIDGVPLGQRV